MTNSLSPEYQNNIREKVALFSTKPFFEQLEPIHKNWMGLQMPWILKKNLEYAFFCMYIYF